MKDRDKHQAHRGTKSHDDAWVTFLRSAAKNYNEPPAVPRDAMWDRISAEREGQRALLRADADKLAADSDSRGPVSLPWWHSRRFLWPAAAAAALVLGFFIGRQTVFPERTEVGTGSVVVQRTDQPGEVSNGDQHTIPGERAGLEVYQLAAAPVLTRAEMLLVQFRTGEIAHTNGHGFADRAARLLAETRLLLDSPAAQDHELSRLLSDLELVLAQLVRITADTPGAQQDIINESMQRRALLPRLRTQVPDPEARINL